MDRLTATEAASAAATRLEFLAEASATLARSLDYEDTLRRVARLAIPTLADWCSIEVIEDGRLRPVAIRHTDPDKVALAQRLRDTFPPSLDDQTGAGAVARTGVTELIEKVDAEMLDALALEPQLRQMVDDLSLSSALTVALRARGRTLGVLSLVFAESGRRYTPDDLTFAEDLGRRAAVAIDNALLHTETSNAALELQRAVLPESFADSSSWQVAVHYQPAGRAHLVGGDFYDALTLPDGRLVALVGDVMGRGVAAAAAMAQIRSAVRAYLIEDPDPGEVVARLDRMFEVLDSEQLVTMMYALVAADATSASVVCAGHLPPVVVGGDGRSRLLPVPSTPPLGVGVTPRPPAVVALDPGDVVLAYTDGLVERRGEDIDVGVARLVAEAGCLAGGASNHALASLAQRLGHTGHDDDITVLAFRSAPRRAADELPEDDPS
jgi:serine phosphatase RsbU (regulator of sigma subunit)